MMLVCGGGFNLRSSYYQSDNTDLIEQANFNYRHNNLDIFGSVYYNQMESWQDFTLQLAPAVCELEGPIMFGPITSNTLINDIFFLLWISIIVLHVYGNNLIICKFLIIFYHLGIKEANLSLTLTKINVKNEKTGLLFLYWAVTITVQIENNFKNAVSKTGNGTKFKEKAGGTEWIIAILMGEVVAQDLN